MIRSTAKPSLPGVRCVVALLAIAVASAVGAQPMPAFTYQGELSLDGQRITDSCDFDMSLHDAVAGGTMVVDPYLAEGVVVADGRFTVEIPGWPATVWDGSRWLEIAVACPTGETLVLLAPRTPITAAPTAALAYYVGADGVATSALQIDAVTSAKLGPAAVTADKIATAAVGASKVAAGEVQLRVGAACPEGNSIRAIDEDGSVSCETDDNTTYSAGAGLQLTGTTFSLAINEALDMQSNVILNIGNPGTDFTPTGGLILADRLTVSDVQSAGTLQLVSDGAVIVKIDENNSAGNFEFNVRSRGATSPNLMAVSEVGLTTLRSSSVTGGLRVTNTDATATTPVLSLFSDAALTTNIFRVNRSGNTTIAGTLGVTGTLSANGGIALGSNTLNGGAAAIDFTNFDVASNGDTTIGGTLAVDGTLTVGGGTAVAALLSATAVIDFGPVAPNGCVDSATPITVTGAQLGDTVSLGIPHGSVVANSSYNAWVSALDTVNVRLCNHGSISSVDPASGTFRATVIRF